ncbi:hypothetical protein A2U01_0003431, partial [Trifolium medium]|nr:hypothetical protein [Trifolium medium]
VVDPNTLTKFEKDLVQFLEFFDLIPFRDLLKAKGDDTTLDSVLRKMSRATDAQWKAHLAATRRQRAAVNQPNSVPANTPLVAENSPAIKRGIVDIEENVGGSHVGDEILDALAVDAKSPKNKKAKKEKVVSKDFGPVEKISATEGRAKTFIPTESSHLPLSLSVDAAEFIDDHYSFNWEDEKIQNMDLEEATTLKLSHELRAILMGRVVTHKAAALAREMKARRAELDEANGKMKEAKDSARAFEDDLKKEERTRVNEVNTLLEDAEQALKLKDKEIKEVDPFKVIKDGNLVDQEVPATPGPSGAPTEGEVKVAGENPDVIIDVAQPGFRTFLVYGDLTL